MSSSPLGIHTSGTEVTNVSTHGFWLLSGGKELFLSYKDFPWFKDASIGNVIAVEEVSPGHFYWPELDVDLGIQSIENPEKNPLTSK